MDNAGTFQLAALQISAARALSLLSPVPGLDGMSAVSLEANFQYGSGGSSCSAIVATSFDQGTTWRHIARFDFTTATAIKIANISGLISETVSAYSDLASQGVNDGLLGSELAVFLISTGTYVNTNLSVHASVR